MDEIKKKLEEIKKEEARTAGEAVRLATRAAVLAGRLREIDGVMGSTYMSAKKLVERLRGEAASLRRRQVRRKGREIYSN